MPPPRGELQAAAAAAVLQLHVVAREQYTGILKNIMPFSVLKYLVVRQPARFRKESQQPGWGADTAGAEQPSRSGKVRKDTYMVKRAKIIIGSCRNVQPIMRCCRSLQPLLPRHVE